MAHRDPGTDRGGLLSIRNIVLLGLIARVAAVLVLNRLGFSQPVNEHWQIAHSLHEGRGFAFDWYGLFPEPQVGSFLPPLYPWVLSLCLALGGGRDLAALWLAQGFNVVLGTATIWLVARLAQQAEISLAAPSSVPRGLLGAFRGIVPVSAARMAALVWAVYPPALGHAAQTQSQVLETFLLAILCLLALRETGPGTTHRTTTVPRALGAGLTLGLLLLTRPTMLLVWFLWVAALLFRRGTGRPASPRRFLLLATACALLAVLPWTIRNARVHGRLVTISTNGGFNFYMGNNPTGDGGIPPLVFYFPRLTEEERLRDRAMSETERDRRFYALGLEYWRAQPARALRGVWTRIVSYVLWRPYLFVAYPRWVAAVFVSSYLLVLAAFLLALPRCRGPACTLPLLALLGTGLVGMVWIVSMRFRATVEPFLVAVGAAGLTTARGRGSPRSGSR
jgi:4-amino-4-deoxy-L-arabinose transferase-like glycosyltransferase